jgi:hypothetical protein
MKKIFILQVAKNITTRVVIAKKASTTLFNFRFLKNMKLDTTKVISYRSVKTNAIVGLSFIVAR